jgi:hypothetical protein
MTSEPIRGQVARVLNTRELAINRGSADGVTEGMRFAVLDTAAEGIRDPETGEDIGSVYRTKVRVEVVVVKDRFSIARTYGKRRVNVGGSGIGTLGDAFKPPRWETRFETLKASEAAWEELSEERSLVKTGDPIEEIVQRGDEGEDSDGRAANPGEDLTTN